MDYEVKERPILFRSEMVNAILDDGRKSQTRRIVNKRGFLPNKGCDFDRDFPSVSELYQVGDAWRSRFKYFNTSIGEWKCPYGKVGDRLWMRETWRVLGRNRGEGWEQCIEYRADHSSTHEFRDAAHWNLAKAWADRRIEKNQRGWCTPIHMPRWASRILLEITSIGCERVQDITEADCFAEGIQIPVDQHRSPIVQISGKIFPAQYVPDGFFTKHDANNRRLGGSGVWTNEEYTTWVKAHYAALWDSINGVGSWAENPWVWRIAFKRIT